MTTKYQTEHYEDVAKLIQRTNGCSIRYTAEQFADLFAADYPPYCSYCGRSSKADRSVCDDPTLHHNFQGGFDKAKFLAACGLEGDN